MIKFENVERSKSLGKLSGNTSVGIATKIYAEVVNAEYAKDSDGKTKQSKSGNKVVALNCKVTEDITKKDGSKTKIPTYFNVEYYETDFSPKLREIKPTENLKKYAEISYNTGGCGKTKEDSPFGWFKVRNYLNDSGIPKNNINIKGGNIQVAIKKEGIYTVKNFDGDSEVFVQDQNIKVNLKGFIEPIQDTEKYLLENYNKGLNRLNFNVYYMENDGDVKYDTTMPCSLENMDENRVNEFIKFVKNNSDRIIGFRGKVKKYAIQEQSDKPKENTSSSKIGAYEYGGGFDTIGYEARLLIDFDENKNNWVIMTTENTGKLVLESNKTEVSVDESAEKFPF